MAGPQGSIRYLPHGGTVTFRIEGRGTMAQSLPLRRQAEQSFAAGAAGVRIDLRDCTYMDSTFVGTLLNLKKTADRRGPHGFILLAPSTACDRILQQMGLSEILETDASATLPPEGWIELSCEVNDVSSFKRTIAQAHEELAKLPGPTGEQFQQALRCMQQADRSKPPAPAPAPSPPRD